MNIEIGYQNSICYDLRSYFERMPGSLIRCAMCAGTLEYINPQPAPYGQALLDYGMMPNLDTFLYICRGCGWWAVRECGADLEYDGAWDNLVVGAVQEWDLASKDVPVSVLREHFAKNAQKLELKALDAYVFEKLIAECLRYEYKPCEVHHVGARGGKGDDGIDLYLVKDGTEWLIQVKRRLTEHNEPVDTVRLLNGVLLREGKHKGMVVTSAAGFTRKAQLETKVKTPGAYCVELFDRGDVLRMIANIPRDLAEPWQPAFREESLWKSPEALSEEFAALFLPPRRYT